MGVLALIECGFSVPLIETKGLEMPSWDADVGTLKNGLPTL
jgi:hypothetical protein